MESPDHKVENLADSAYNPDDEQEPLKLGIEGGSGRWGVINLMFSQGIDGIKGEMLRGIVRQLRILAREGFQET